MDAYLRGLVVQIEVLDARQNANDADDLPVARTAIGYDDYAVMEGMENYGGTATTPGHLLAYDATLTVRGNATAKTVWAGLQTNESITHLAKFDIFGNAVKTQVSCCNTRSATLGDLTYWSQPNAITQGAPGGPQITTTGSYSFGSSLLLSKTDPGNQTMNYAYDGGQWRATDKRERPSGHHLGKRELHL